MDNQDKKRTKRISKQNKVYCFIYCFTNPPFTNPPFTNPVHVLQIQSTPLQSMFYHMPAFITESRFLRISLSGIRWASLIEWPGMFS